MRSTSTVRRLNQGAGYGGGSFMGYDRDQERGIFELVRQSRFVLGDTLLRNNLLGERSYRGNDRWCTGGRGHGMCYGSRGKARQRRDRERVGAAARARDSVFLAFDVRRGAYKLVGVPTYREIVNMYRHPQPDRNVLDVDDHVRAIAALRQQHRVVSRLRRRRVHSGRRFCQCERLLSRWRVSCGHSVGGNRRMEILEAPIGRNPAHRGSSPAATFSWRATDDQT